MKSTPWGPLFCAVGAAAGLWLAPPAVRADPLADAAALHVRAQEVFKGNDPHREEILKKLHDENPNDGSLCFYYGYALLVRAGSMDPGPKRVALVKEGRRYLLQAQKSGLVQPLIEMALGTFHEDGTFAAQSFSKDSQVDACVKAAEKAFAARKFDEALRHYQEALAVDPANYSATLYTGDTYFSTGRLEDALKWFDRAIALDPNRETAYRYRGDALEKLHRQGEALDSFVAAVVAEPYNRLPWNTLTVVAQQRGYAAKYRAAPLPRAEVKLEDGKPAIVLPPNPGALTLAYAAARVAWFGENRAQVFPDGSYRQSLAEEKHVLESLLAIALELRDSSGQKSEPDREVALTEASFHELKQIVDAGLLEPHILLTRANRDLAQDYGPYREKNREKLAEYIRRFYLGLE
jgi:tetratricopeptide (TPR) repeat protein